MCEGRKRVIVLTVTAFKPLGTNSFPFFLLFSFALSLFLSSSSFLSSENEGLIGEKSFQFDAL